MEGTRYVQGRLAADFGTNSKMRWWWCDGWARRRPSGVLFPRSVWPMVRLRFSSRALWHFSMYNMNRAFCCSTGNQKRPWPRCWFIQPTTYTSPAESCLKETLVGRRTWRPLAQMSLAMWSIECVPKKGGGQFNPPCCAVQLLK